MAEGTWPLEGNLGRMAPGVGVGGLAWMVFIKFCKNLPDGCEIDTSSPACLRRP